MSGRPLEASGGPLEASGRPLEASGRLNEASGRPLVDLENFELTFLKKALCKIFFNDRFLF